MVRPAALTLSASSAATLAFGGQTMPSSPMHTDTVHTPSVNNSHLTPGQPADQRTAQLLEARCVHDKLTRTTTIPGSFVTAYSFAARDSPEQADKTATFSSTPDDGVPTLPERAVYCHSTTTIQDSPTTGAIVVETPVQPSHETKVISTTELIPMMPEQTNGMTQATPTASTTLTTVATVVTPTTTATDVTTHDGLAYEPVTTISNGAGQRVRPFWR